MQRSLPSEDTASKPLNVGNIAQEVQLTKISSRKHQLVHLTEDLMLSEDWRA